MIRCERAPSVSGEHPTAHSGEGRRGGAGVLVGPVAPSRACYVRPVGAAPFTARLCVTRVTGPLTPIYHPVTRVGRFFAFLCDPYKP
jgi:hypothetical protein